MHSRNLPWVLSVAVSLFLAGACTAQEIVTTPAKASGVYDVGETISWKIEVKGTPAATQVHYVLRKNEMGAMKDGTIELASGAGTLETSLDEPGTVLAELSAKAGGKEIKALAGAAIAPEKIQPSAPKPQDFDAFWQAKIDQLNAIPANPKVEPAESGDPGVDYFKVQLDNINGTHVYGQLAKPKKEGKFPAMLIVQYAGIYALPQKNVVPRGKAGWLAFNIMAHDLPFDQPEAFYKNAADTTLKNYMTLGNSDREKCYFLRMYLGCYRAADYLANRPDWDGKTLIVWGTSQGGQQTIVTAGIYPKITCMMANVPAGCDTTGPLAGRFAGFPYWYNNAKGKPNEKQIMETSRYFDDVNFASRVKCPALVATGLIDQTCPPAGVYAAFNQMQGPKEILPMVNSNHHGDHNAQAAYWSKSEQWARELQKGNAVRVE